MISWSQSSVVLLVIAAMFAWVDGIKVEPEFLPWVITLCLAWYCLGRGWK